MALNFHKKNHGDNESFWTSYSDLFLGLSSIFLMLYVVASLRSGTDGLKQAVENKKLKVEVQDLQNQLKTYESIKENYMKTQASNNEVDEYTELMDKLSLLQDEASSEKMKLRQAAKENEQKEKALNKYQQMVRNVINTSTLAKVKINNRNDIITERDVTIDDQGQEITTLNQNVNTMTNQIRTKDRQIASAKNELSEKEENLKKMLKKQKLSQKAYQARLKKLQADAGAEIQALQNQKAQTQNNLAQTKAQLNSAQAALNQTQADLSNTQGQLAAKGAEVGRLNEQIGQLNAEGQAKIAGLQKGFADQQKRDREAFEGALRNQKNLGAAEIARKEAEFQAASDAKERKLAGEISGLVGQLKSAEGQLRNTAGQLKDTQGQLAAANAELEARKKIANEISKGFKQAGIKADIDMGTGDVVLDFGQAYFDSGSSNLKNEMKGVLQKAMPVYAKSLFGNAKVASEISAVEIIGFASPTYKGKVVDPYSTSPEDREALKYNMDLSYQRAKSIFNYILDEKNMQFSHRDTMVPNLKVSGRSFLDLMKTDRSIASAQDYCQKYDCKKSQRVIIKFNMNKK